MRLKTKTKEVTTYRLEMSELEARQMLSDVVDAFAKMRYDTTRQFRNDAEVAGAFPKLEWLRQLLHNET